MKLPNKDQILLEQSYEQVREAHGPISGAASRANANPGIHYKDGSLAKEEDIQKAQDLLMQYSKGLLTSKELADELDALFRKEEKQEDPNKYDPDTEAEEFQSPDFSQ